MRAQYPEFSDRTLDELLRALHARTTDHPDNPGLIASWPGVREERMAAACAELRRRGHPVFRVVVEGAKQGVTREAWAIAARTDQPVTAADDVAWIESTAPPGRAASDAMERRWKDA